MSPNLWKWILAFALGSAIGVVSRRGLMLMFGRSGPSISVSTMTMSSILWGFSGATIGYGQTSASVSKDLQSIVTFGFLGIIATVAALATAAQALLSPQDVSRVRRRLGVHCDRSGGSPGCAVVGNSKCDRTDNLPWRRAPRLGSLADLELPLNEPWLNNGKNQALKEQDPLSRRHWERFPRRAARIASQQAIGGV